MSTIDTQQSTSLTDPLSHAHLLRTLSAMMAQIATLQHLARDEHAADPSALRNGLAALEQVTREMLYEVRAASDDEAIDTLPDAPLAEVLSRLVDETAEALQLSSRVIVSGEERPLPIEAERMLYRVARELLAQTRQHSGARRLRFTLHYGRVDAQMSIEDDGVPSEQAALSIFAGDTSTTLAPPFSANENSGDDSLYQATLLLLRNRVEQLGGSLEIITSIEHGTQARVTIPYVHNLPAASSREQLVSQTPTAQAARIRILIVDNQAVTRAGLRRLLESYADLQVVGEAIDGVQAVSETAELGPQVVILDAQLPQGQSLEALRQVKQLNLDTHVLLLSTLDREEYLYETLRAGAEGFVLKDIAPDELAQAVRAVARGEVLVQPQIAGRLISRFGKQGHAGSLLDALTPRELEVLRLLARGLRNKEIAARLFVSERTVNFHLANIYQKMNVSGRTEALSKAHEQGLITA
ncbi:MAG TPA: LuxR C-terminal-related transcriptional regulator [Chthonomonadales bacterium]|nr:LuxR C-terminal-related transcriptional regulator [Chthonomonadales bacterium]